jgi:LytS/YehU family sensor histidine kinase
MVSEAEGNTVPLSEPTSRYRWIALIGAAALVTLAAFALALYARQLVPGLPPLTPAELPGFDFHPYWVGLLVQIIVVPVALIYLFSKTRLFLRVISGQVASRDTLKLFAVLAAIQLLAHVYDLWLTRLIGEPSLLNLLVVVVGGLLGGWKVGLGLGFTTMLFRGSQHLLPGLVPELGAVLRHLEASAAEGLIGWRYLPWGEMFLGNYVANLWASSAVWAGVVTGLGAELLGQRRFAPLAAVVLGVVAEVGSGCLGAITGEMLGLLFLIPNVLVSGLALAAITLMVRGVQAETARRKAEAAELALAHAELRALRAQINPHFLFNALNTIRYFVRTDPETARRLLLNLSEIFQRALRSGEFVPLRDELSYVEAYLALEKARLGDRLNVEWAIETETWLDHPVPTLILQPIVENAVIHGIARKPEGGTVRITIEQADGDLLLRVEDDGPGIEPARLAEILDAGQASVAIGLRNIDGRLRTLYSDDYRLAVESEVGHGTSVQIRIPIAG